MPAGGLLTGGIAAGAGALISGITGLFQKKKAKKLLADNPYPTEVVPEGIQQNQQMAQNMANEGLPSQQYQQGLKNIERSQNAALAAATDRRSGVANIGAIQEQSNNATGNLDVANSQARLQNQQRLMGANTASANWQDKTWQWNSARKYMQNYQYAMGLIGAGNQNILGGLDRLVGAGTSLIGGMGGKRNNTSSTSMGAIQGDDGYI